MSRCRTPSRSLYWRARKRTRAWATVRRTVLTAYLSCSVADVIGSRGSMGWPAQVPRIQAWAGSSQKRQARSARRARHHVEVVQVVAGGGDRRPVPAVRDEHDVARADLGQHVDGAAGSAVDPLVAEPGGLEVVDLLEFGLVLARLVVLVRRVGRPVPARREHLDGDELVALERLGRAEVVDLPAGLARAAQFHRHRLGRAVAGRQPSLAPGARQGERAAVLGRHRDRGVARRVAEVADAGEHAAPSL